MNTKSICVLFAVVLLFATQIATAQVDKAEQARQIYNEAFQLSSQNTVESMQTAISKFEQARRLYKNLNSRKDEVNCLYNLGNLSERLRKNFEAVEYYLTALSLERAAGDKQSEVVALKGIARLYFNLEEKQKGIEYELQILALYRAIGDKAAEADSLSAIGYIYSDFGEKRKALEYYGQALLLYRFNKDKEGEASVLRGAGDIYSFYGEYQKALEYYNQALPLFRLLDNKLLEAFALDSIGITHTGLGEFRKAIAYHQQSLLLFQTLNDKSFKSSTLNLIGRLHRSLGEQRQALESYRLSSEISRAVGNKVGEALALIEIGSIHSDLKENNKAIEFYEQALQLARAIGGNKYAEGQALSRLGEVYGNTRAKDKALEYYNQALSVHRASGDKAEEAIILNKIGIAYEKSGDNQKALEYFAQALPMYRAVGDKRGEAVLLGNLSFSRTINNPRFATFYAKLSVNTYQGLRSNLVNLDKNTQQTFLKSIEDSYRSLADILIAQNRFSEAQQVLNAFKDQQFFDSNQKLEITPLTLTVKERKFGESLNKQIERVGNLNLKVSEFRRKKVDETKIKTTEVELATAEGGYKVFLDTLEREFLALPAQKDESFVTADSVNMQTALRELSAATGEQTVAVYTLVGEKEYKVVIVTQDSIDSASFPISAEQLNDKALLLYTALKTVWRPEDTPDKRLWNKPRYDAQPPAKELYDTIFAPLYAKLPKDTKTILWSLDGTLRYVPMSALYDGKQYLVERYKTTVFTRADKERLTRNVAANVSGTGFGSSDAQNVKLGTATLTASALPGVKKELERIFKITPNATTGILSGEVFLNQDFNRTNMKAALGKRRPLVLIASHFRFVPNDEANSFLLLGDGTPFTLDEMKREKELFAGVDLLTLSACETAAQLADANGREVDGFAELAQRLGAGAVMASLWEVSDQSTSELMTRFFTNYNAATGKNKVKALQQSQLALLRGEYQTVETSSSPKRYIVQDETGTASKNKKLDVSRLRPFNVDNSSRFAHPFYWSPFILIGNVK